MVTMDDTSTPEQLLAETDWLRGLAWHLMGDAHDADDLYQETVLVALRRQPTRRCETHFNMTRSDGYRILM